MKKIKLVSMLLIFILTLSFITPAVEYKNGDIINEAVYSDIKAYINDVPIISYNINGYTAIIAEDLIYYGFNLTWNGDTRTLSIDDFDINKSLTSIKELTVPKVLYGYKAYDVLKSDIITSIKTKTIESFNIGGKTAIYIDSLSEYGPLTWDGDKRTISLTSGIRKVPLQTTGTTNYFSQVSKPIVAPIYLYSNDQKTYLGKITIDKYDSESIWNEYGTYGSEYRTNSIMNKYGTYGSEYSSYSAMNTYASKPPVIIDSNGQYFRIFNCE